MIVALACLTMHCFYHFGFARRLAGVAVCIFSTLLLGILARRETSGETYSIFALPRFGPCLVDFANVVAVLGSCVYS